MRHGYWPTYIGPIRNFSTVTRQRKRRASQVANFANLRRQFGGFTDRGGYYYAEGMNRRITRQIARDTRVAV